MRYAIGLSMVAFGGGLIYAGFKDVSLWDLFRGEIGEFDKGKGDGVGGILGGPVAKGPSEPTNRGTAPGTPNSSGSW